MSAEIMLKNIACEEGILNPVVENHLKSSKGRGYLSYISAANIRGNDKNGKEVTLNLLVKSAATNKKIRECSAAPEVFRREVFIYESVFPIYSDFETSKGIVNPFPNVPKYYKTYITDDSEIIVLNNLTEEGYQIWDRRLEMEDAHVRIVLKAYGEFHAVSFALQDQQPEIFRRITKNIDNIFNTFLEKSGFFDTFITKAKRAQASLNPKVDRDLLSKYAAFLNGIEERFENLVRCDEKYFAILHGDSWSNNMLFKYEDSGDTERPTSIRLIDFQFARLGSPVCDLMYFFYPCSSKQVLQNLNVYKQVYYESFQNHLRKLGSNPDKVYPVSVFEEHWRKYAAFGLVASSLLRYMMLVEEAEAVDFTDVVESGNNISKVFDGDIANLNKYYERMRYVIEHHAENNFI